MYQLLLIFFNFAHHSQSRYLYNIYKHTKNQRNNYNKSKPNRIQNLWALRFVVRFKIISYKIFVYIFLPK